jgi:hypothetical protein
MGRTENDNKGPELTENRLLNFIFDLIENLK